MACICISGPVCQIWDFKCLLITKTVGDVCKGEDCHYVCRQTYQIDKDKSGLGTKHERCICKKDALKLGERDYINNTTG